jgi:ferredoxin-NADP reductase
MARAALLGRLSWLVATVVSAHKESLTARTITVEAPGWTGHLPGQHVDVRLTAADGYSTQRSYSIASAWDPAAERPLLDLTVEEVDDGEVSPFLVEVLRIGDPFELRGPVGGWFVWRDSDPTRTLLVAGGSGVVPLMAMLRGRRLARSTAPFRLLYSVRAPISTMYAEELTDLAGDGSGLDVDFAYTRQAPADWTGSVGRVQPAQLLAGVGGQPAEAAFVCGPTGFVEAMADVLAGSGLDPGRIRTERFGPTGG